MSNNITPSSTSQILFSNPPPAPVSSEGPGILNSIDALNLLLGHWNDSDVKDYFDNFWYVFSGAMPFDPIKDQNPDWHNLYSDEGQFFKYDTSMQSFQLASSVLCDLAVCYLKDPSNPVSSIFPHESRDQFINNLKNDKTTINGLSNIDDIKYYLVDMQFWIAMISPKYNNNEGNVLRSDYNKIINDKSNNYNNFDLDFSTYENDLNTLSQ